MQRRCRIVLRPENTRTKEETMSSSAISPEVESAKARLKIIRPDWFTKRGALIVTQSRVRHSPSWGSSAIHVGELSYLRGRGVKTDTNRHPLLGVGKQACNPTS